MGESEKSCRACQYGTRFAILDGRFWMFSRGVAVSPSIKTSLTCCNQMLSRGERDPKKRCDYWESAE